VNVSFGGALRLPAISTSTPIRRGQSGAHPHLEFAESATPRLLFHLSEPAALVITSAAASVRPSSFDLYSNGVHEGTVAFERGNPNLKTEKSLNTDVRLRADVTYLVRVGDFLNLIQDYIYTVRPHGR